MEELWLVNTAMIALAKNRCKKNWRLIIETEENWEYNIEIYEVCKSGGLFEIESKRNSTRRECAEMVYNYVADRID